mgnify:CR=1 FL=1
MKPPTGLSSEVPIGGFLYDMCGILCNHCTFSEIGNQEIINFSELECRQIVKSDPEYFCHGQKTRFPLYDCTLCRN